MSHWFLNAGVRYQTIGTIGHNASLGTLIACTSADTKGDYGELIASTPFDAQGILVHFGKPSASRGVLLDIGIGTQGGERVLIPDLHQDNVHAGASPISSYYFPIEIPTSSRLTTRVAASASATVHAMAVLVSRTLEQVQPFSRVKTYGKVTSGSTGTQIDCGATANVKGSWVQIGNLEMDAKMVIISLGAGQNTQLAEADFLMDIGIGLPGVETAAMSNIPFASSTVGDTFYPRTIGPLPCSIGAGQWVSVRAQCSTTDSADRLFNVLLHFIG